METRQSPTTEVGSDLDESAIADAAYDKIRRRAYEIWEREGRPTGRQHEHWAQAEREVMAEAGFKAGRGTLERQ